MNSQGASEGFAVILNDDTVGFGADDNAAVVFEGACYRTASYDPNASVYSVTKNEGVCEKAAVTAEEPKPKAQLYLFTEQSNNASKLTFENARELI